MNKDKLQEIVINYRKSKIQSEEEIRSKLIIPLLDFLEYPSEVRAEEFPVYGFEGRKRLPTKNADFILFSDKNYADHIKFSVQDLEWVSNHSLLIVEAKKPNKLPDILGQPIYYTIWTKAVAYLATDGEQIKGYFFDSIIEDIQIIDCKIDQLFNYNEIYFLTYHNILSIKENKKISWKYIKDQGENLSWERKLDERFMMIESKKTQSLLERRFEKIEVKNFMDRLKRAIALKKECNDLVDNEIFPLMPYGYFSDHEIGVGRHFSLPNIQGIVTLVYEVYKVIDYKTLSKSYACELVDNGIIENDSEFITYFIDDFQEDFGNQLIMLQFDIYNNRVFIYLGLLVNNEVRFLSPQICRFSFASNDDLSIDNIYLSGAVYDKDSLSEIYEKILNEGESERIILETDILNKAPAIIIDPSTGEMVKRKIYYDEKEKCLKSQIEIEKNKSYFAFKLMAGKEVSTPLTDLEIGEYYRSGEYYGFPKNLFKAIHYFEKDGSGEALFEIANIFKDEPTVEDDELYFEYLCKSAELKFYRAIIELTLHIYDNETSIKSFSECISLFDGLEENFIYGDFILAYFIEKNMVDDRNIEDSFELYYKSALKGYKPSQVRLQCHSREEIENTEKMNLYNKFIKSLHRQDIISYCLGSIYFFGINIRERKEIGINLLLEAANLDNINAQNTLFEIYDNDKEFIDERKALKWLKKIAEKDKSVYIKLSNRLIEGVGCEITEENDRQALYFLRQAALSNDKTAINNLGWMYMNGRGCNVDYYNARNLFERAASLGSVASWRWLGEIYEKGFGVIINIEKAKEYYRLAAEGGNEGAKKRLEELKNTIT